MMHMPACNLNLEVCKERCINFIPFNVSEGLNGGEFIDSRKFNQMQFVTLEFDIYPYIWLIVGRYSEKELSEKIEKLEAVAREEEFPIDSLILIYEGLRYLQKGYHFIACFLSRI